MIPRFADQPIFAQREARYRGEAVAAIVGDREVIQSLDLSTFPVTWEELPALKTIDEAIASFYETLGSEEEEPRRTPPDEFMESLVRGTAAHATSIEAHHREIRELAHRAHARGGPQHPASRRL